MRTTLRISLFTNLLLLSWVGYLAIEPAKRATKPLLPSQNPGGPGPVDVVSLGQPARLAPADAKPFRWSQVVASDYRAYMANLRAIGCPERTIRCIVTADLEGIYAAKRAQLRLDGSGAGPWSNLEEMRLLARLLGEASVVPHADTELAREDQPKDQRSPSLPLAFRSAEQEDLDLDSEQRDALQELRELFILEVGGIGQNPNDPGYAARWQAAQPRLDEALTGLVGRQAFLRLQMEGSTEP